MHRAMKYLVYQLRLSASLEMADSGQQPTAGSEVETLVNDIFDMMSEMKIRKIAIGFLEMYFNKLLHDLPSLPPEVSAKRMRKFK